MTDSHRINKPSRHRSTTELRIGSSVFLVSVVGALAFVHPLSACSQADLQANEKHAPNPIAELAREGGAFDVELNTTNKNPIYRLRSPHDAKLLDECPFFTVTGQMTCEALSNLSIPRLRTEIVRTDVSHYLFAGGYGCESAFCLHDLNDRHWINESPVITYAIKEAISYLRVGNDGPQDASILVVHDKGVFKSICFYPAFVDSNREEIIDACRRVAKEG